jgi:hypothetical protein
MTFSPGPQHVEPAAQHMATLPPLQHFWPALQHLALLPLPQENWLGPHVTSSIAAKPWEARPKPKEANTAPPTAPPTSLNASRLEIELAIIRDMSSKSTLISLLLLTTLAATGMGRYIFFPCCHVLGNHTSCPFCNQGKPRHAARINK